MNQIAAAQIADAVVDGEGHTRDHLVGGMGCLNLELEASLLRLLIHHVDHEGEVGLQGLEVALQVGRRLDQVDTCRQVSLNA